jgi:VanZ family protein
MNQFLKKYAVSLGVNLIILFLCLVDSKGFPDAPMTNFDKFVHLVMFMGISGVVFFDNTSYLRKRINSWRIFWGSFFFSLLFGGAIELMQAYFVPTRSGDWMDFFFDGLGASVGALVCWLINLRLKRSH